MSGFGSKQVETAETILPCAALQVTHFLLFCALLHPSSWKIKMMTPSCDDSIKYMHTPIHMCVYISTYKYMCVYISTYTHICVYISTYTYMCVHVWTCIYANTNTHRDTLFIQHMSYQKHCIACINSACS